MTECSTILVAMFAALTMATPTLASPSAVFNGDKATSVSNLVKREDECGVETMHGMFVKRVFENDGLKPKGYVFEEANGERIYINAPILDADEIGNASYGATLSALGQLSHEGNHVQIFVVWCAKAATMRCMSRPMMSARVTPRRKRPSMPSCQRRASRHGSSVSLAASNTSGNH